MARFALNAEETNAARGVLQRRALVTLNTNDYLTANARASHQAAAARWGCAYLELTTPWVDRTDPFGVKLHLHELPVSPEARVCWVDADVLIRADCPSPFDRVPPWSFGGVRNFQGDTHSGDPYPSHALWWQRACDRLDVDIAAHPYDPGRYINGGLLVFRLADHGHLWERAAKAFRHGPVVHPMDEQTALNVLIAATETPLAIMRNEMCRLGPVPWTHPGPMACHVYHLANLEPHRNPRIKRERLETIDWRAVP